MKSNNPHTEIASLERRNFMKLAAAGSFTVAAVAGAAGTLWSSEAIAQTAKEESDRERAADHIMTIATAYAMTADRSYPIMQKVQGGTIQAAQHSLSNFAPFAPVVDLINLPYLCGANQRFVNLVSSDHWKNTVNPLVEAKGFKPLYYVVIDPRVVAVRKGGAGPVKTPADLKGVKFRVPGSKMLQQYYRMVGANPTPVAWGETPSAIKQGVADALDPAVGALHVFGFKDILSYITFTRAVPDSQVYSCNAEWFNGLPADVQEGIEFASEITSQQNLAKVPAARNYAMAELSKSGVEFYTPTADELAEWEATGGYQRSEWDSYKTELAGSMDAFDKMVEAAGTQGRNYVHDA